MKKILLFFETYGITEGDGMWLKPEDRIQVW
jgi:predicted metalloendopeptidase